MGKIATEAQAPSLDTVKQEVSRIAEAAVVEADAYEIDGPEMAELAAETLRKLSTEYKRVEELRFSITRPMDAAKAAAIAAFKPYLDRIDAAKTSLGGKVNAYLLAERKRQEEEAAEARRLQAIEDERLAAERKAAEDAAATAADNGDEEAFEQAAAALANIEAEEELAQVTSLPVAAAHKLSGVSQRATWKVGEIDLAKLVAAAAADPALLQFLQADSVAIGKVVRATGEGHRIPGVKAVRETSLSTRRF